MTIPSHWRRFLRRVFFLLLIGVALMMVPMPILPASVLSYRQAIIVFGLVVGIGKLLYDTLFYDHYWP